MAAWEPGPVAHPALATTARPLAGFMTIMRVPPAGEARANLHAGARAEKSSLTRRDREICEAIGPTLKERGLIFVGIDIIGDYMTEINVTSPTGIQEIDRFDKVSIESQICSAQE